MESLTIQLKENIRVPLANWKKLNKCNKFWKSATVFIVVVVYGKLAYKFVLPYITL